MSLLLSRARLPSLDALRGLNIIAMIVYHYNLIYFPQPIDAITLDIATIGGYVAPMFSYLAGAGTWFFLQRHAPVTLLKRGIFLFFVATLVSIFPKGHWYIEWTLIQTISFAFVTMGLIAQFTARRFVTTLILYLACGAALVTLNLRIPGFFPIFPDAFFFLIGYGFAVLCPVRCGGKTLTWQATAVLVLGLGLLISGTVATPFASNSLAQWYADAASKSGVFVVLYFTFVWVLGHWRYENQVGQYLVQIGRIPLTAYYLQQVLLRFLQAIHFQPIIVNSLTSYLLVLLTVLISSYIVLAIWRNLNFTLSLEWMMRRL